MQERLPLLYLPNIVGLKQFGKVVVRFLGLELLYLIIDGPIVGWCFDIADDAESNRKIGTFHQSQFQLERIVLTMGVMYENVLFGNAVLSKLDDFQIETVLNETEFIIFSKEKWLAMFDEYGVSGTALLAVDFVVSTVVEDNAILQDFTNGASLMFIRRFQNLYRSGPVGSYGAGEEVAAGTETELCRAERIFHGAVRTRFAHETSRRRGRILALGQTVDSVVQKNHVQIDIPSVGMYEVIAADGEAVAVTADLPYRKFRIGHFATRGDGCSPAVDSIHAVGVHIVRQAR